MDQHHGPADIADTLNAGSATARRVELEFVAFLSERPMTKLFYTWLDGEHGSHACRSWPGHAVRNARQQLAELGVPHGSERDARSARRGIRVLMRTDVDRKSTRGTRRPSLVLAGVLSLGLITMSSAEEPGEQRTPVEMELATVRAQLGALLDREAIRQLAVSYAHFARTRDIDALVALYSSNAVFDVAENMGTAAGPRAGHEAIRETLSVDLPRADPWPFLHQHFIEILGHDRARGTLYFELRLGVEQLRVTHIGAYIDEYVKEQGVWKFRSRKLAATPLPAAASRGD